MSKHGVRLEISRRRKTCTDPDIHFHLFLASHTDPVYFGSSQATADEKFYEAYKVALVANFLTGVISAVLAVFGPLILKVVPPAALLVPIAGIGIAFLGLEQTAYSIAAPIVGYSCLAWVYLGWYAKVRIGYGKWRCPEALQVILIGVILGWATGLNDPETLKSAASLVRWLGPDCKWNMGICIP